MSSASCVWACEGDDVLSLARGIDSSLASLEAEKMEYLAGYLSNCAYDGPLVELAGREKMIAYGGSGTPEIPEFAMSQVHAELGISLWAATKLCADALSLTYRLPKIFALLKDGYGEAWRTRMVASATRELSLVEVAAVDDKLSGAGRGGQPLIARMTRSRLHQVLDQIVATTADSPIDDEVTRNLDDRDVSVRPSLPGITDLCGTMATGDGRRLDERLDQVAGWLAATGDQRTKAVRRSIALGMLADPASIDALHRQVTKLRRPQTSTDTQDTQDTQHGQDGHGGEPDRSGDAAPGAPAAEGSAVPADASPMPATTLPATTLYVHFEPGNGSWWLDGDGPITKTQAADLLGHTHVSIKPVIDLDADYTYTGYVAPPRLQEQLRLQNAGKCTFPYCDRPAWDGDYDHIVDYDPNAPPGSPGSTCSRNGHRPCRHHHRVKTFTRWHVESPAPGTWLWQSPRHDHYLVTAGTTTRIYT